MANYSAVASSESNYSKGVASMASYSRAVAKSIILFPSQDLLLSIKVLPHSFRGFLYSSGPYSQLLYKSGPYDQLLYSSET